MAKRLAFALTALLSAALLTAASNPGGEIAPVVPAATVEIPELVCAPASSVEEESAYLFMYNPPDSCPDMQCNRNLDCFLQQGRGVYHCEDETAPICLPCGEPITNCEGYCDCL